MDLPGIPSTVSPDGGAATVPLRVDLPQPQQSPPQQPWQQWSSEGLIASGGVVHAFFPPPQPSYTAQSARFDAPAAPPPMGQVIPPPMFAVPSNHQIPQPHLPPLPMQGAQPALVAAPHQHLPPHLYHALQQPQQHFSQQPSLPFAHPPGARQYATHPPQQQQQAHHFQAHLQHAVPAAAAAVPQPHGFPIPPSGVPAPHQTVFPPADRVHDAGGEDARAYRATVRTEAPPQAAPTTPQALLARLRAATADFATAAAKPAAPNASSAQVSTLQRLVSRAKVTDSEAHAAWLTLDSGPASHALARFASGLGTLRESPALWSDVCDHRGLLLIAVLDHLVLLSAAAGPKSAAPREAATALVGAILRDAAEIGASQRGCITLMRLVSCVHHDAAWVTAAVRALTPLADTAAFLEGPHRPYVLCHVLAGLRPQQQHESGADPQPFFAATAERPGPLARADHIVHFQPWTEALRADPSPANAARLGRDRCDAAAWAAFASGVLRGLTRALPTVLEGRQACFALWYALENLPDVRHTEAGAALCERLSSLDRTATWPPPSESTCKPKAAREEASNPATPPQSLRPLGPLADVSGPAPTPAESIETLALSSAALSDLRVSAITTFTCLCRSTVGRCALIALLDHVLTAMKSNTTDSLPVCANIVRACRAVVADGIPAVDDAQERTLKLRPGMEIASELEERVAAFLITCT